MLRFLQRRSPPPPPTIADDDLRSSSSNHHQSTQQQQSQLLQPQQPPQPSPTINKSNRIQKFFQNFFAKFRIHHHTANYDITVTEPDTVDRNNRNEYYPYAQEKRFGVEQQQQQRRPAPLRQLAQPNINAEDNQTGKATRNELRTHSAMSNDDDKVSTDGDDRSATGDTCHASNANIGTLTRSVINEIDSKSKQRTMPRIALNSQPQNAKLDAAFELIIDSSRGGFNAIVADNGHQRNQSTKQTNRQLSEPIYDVPTSRSMINLIDTDPENLLPVKRQRKLIVATPNVPDAKSQLTHDLSINGTYYYHTSQPNLLSIKSLRSTTTNNNEDESIYDVPRN